MICFSKLRKSLLNPLVPNGFIGVLLISMVIILRREKKSSKSIDKLTNPALTRRKFFFKFLSIGIRRRIYLFPWVLIDSTSISSTDDFLSQIFKLIPSIMNLIVYPTHVLIPVNMSINRHIPQPICTSTNY